MTLTPDHLLEDLERNERGLLTRHGVAIVTDPPPAALAGADDAGDDRAATYRTRAATALKSTSAGGAVISLRMGRFRPGDLMIQALEA